MENEEISQRILNKQLEELKQEIQATGDDVWFFNQNKNEEIKGYWGTDNIIFLALNPSKPQNNQANQATGKFRDFFDQKLIENGFVNAHVTDLIKIRLDEKGVKEFFKDKDKVMEQIEYLKKEIEIINPKIIVFIGKKSENAYKKDIKEDKNIKFSSIVHYAKVMKKEKREEIYNTELKKIREEMERQSISV